MSVPVPIEELADALARRGNTAYLLTVGDNGRVHCVATTLEWLDDQLVVPAGATSVRNAVARRSVVLLAPPAAGLVPAVDSTGRPHRSGAGSGATLETYSLIVDGEVATSADEGENAATGAARTPQGAVRVRPTHAVFHRPATTPEGGHAHDCVHVYDEVAPTR